ncbi:uncharacterized protein [Epargyreus clarus]|uniref:uncharacterized protein n=1 Tax=Epargyreus clarus TaxID=520877 RepID=UPI003C2EDD56
MSSRKGMHRQSEKLLQNIFGNSAIKQGKENVWSLTNRLLKNSPQPTPCLTVYVGNSKHTSSTTDTAHALLDKFYPDDTPDTTDKQYGFKEQTSTVDALKRAIDIIKEAKSSKQLAFADDVLLIVESKKPTDLELSANKALDLIVNWGKGVKLTFGPNKTQIIAFTPKAKAAKIAMDGLALEFVDEIKILGIIIDKNLRFIRHVKHVIDKSLNIYKKLARFVRPTWGAQPENIRTIYKQVIEPTITYAAGIWGSAVKYETVKNQLRSLQRGFALKIIRSFRTVSATAAIALAQLTPLHLKISEVEAMELAKALGTTPLLPDDVILERPVRSCDLLHPADRKCINFAYATTQQEINDYCPPGCTPIYTDGSKNTEDEVGAAFVVYKTGGNKVIRKFKLHKTCSVYQAELLAIQQACKWAVHNENIDVAILTDSLSSLQEIANKDSTNYAVASIHKLIKAINDRQGKVIFIWVKSHIGLEESGPVTA